MSLMIHTVQKEKDRILYMLAAYDRQLDELPRGSVTAKKTGNNVYYYLKYRSGKKVITDYLGKESDKVQNTRAQLKKRVHIEAMIKHLKSELAIANKVLEGSA